MDCLNCSVVNEIGENGIVEMYCNEQVIIEIKNVVDKCKKVDSSTENSLSFAYQSIHELQLLMNEINHFFHEETKKKIKCLLLQKNENRSFTPFLSFSEAYARIFNLEYTSIINQQLFTNYLQPIVSLENFAIYGYEFLLRPKNDHAFFQPGALFSFAQKAGMQSLLDSQARISSIKTSAKHLNKGVKRFINFLPSSIYDPNHCLKSTFHAVKEHDVDPNDLIFEVVETEKIMDIDHLTMIFSVYKKHGIKVALDDLGAGYATNEVLKKLQPNFAKIDRSLIDCCDQSNEKQKRLNGIIEIAKDLNIILLAEGIERKEEADYCRSAGIQLAQGYLFGRPNELPLDCTRVKL